MNVLNGQVMGMIHEMMVSTCKGNDEGRRAGDDDDLDADHAKSSKSHVSSVL